MHMQTHTKKPPTHSQSQTHTSAPTHTLSLFLTHKQERNSYSLEISPDIACHSQRPWSGFAYRTSYSAHTQTHTRSWKGGKKKKAQSHVGGKGGTRQHLQSPLLIALLPAWSQITGLEMLQSGLYLLANLPPPQIHTSKPPSYHLLVNLQQRKRTPWYSEVKLLLSISSFVCVCISVSLGVKPPFPPSRRFGTPTTEFFRTWKGSGQCFFFFLPIFPLSWSFDVRRLESQILVHLPSESIP